MIPIQDILHRIQWDPMFKGDFVIGYHDRVAHCIVRVPFQRLHIEKGQHFSFEAVEDNGTVHTVPFHRVREVWRDGELIWRRDGEGHDSFQGKSSRHT
jgi:uncharacterized protein (UPF0248 family)